MSLNLGLDGCFIKLTTGQQILAAIGRDGNNNIYHIAFGVVDKEDGESWTWFLTQLRCCIGSGNKFGTYTIISDRRKVGVLCTNMFDQCGFSTCWNYLSLIMCITNLLIYRACLRQ